MIANCYEVTESSQVFPCESSQAVEACQRGHGAPRRQVWIDLEAGEPAEYEAWLDRLGLSDLARRLCLDYSGQAALYPLTEELFFVLPVMVETESTSEVVHIVFYCREGLMLTMHRRPFLTTQRLSALEASEAWLHEGSVVALLVALLLDQALDGQRHTRGIRSAIRSLEGRMQREPDSVEAEEILDLRADLLAQDAVVSDQIPIYRALGVVDLPYFRLQKGRGHLSGALANLEGAEGAIDRLENRIGALQLGFQMNSQDTTNRKLNALTVLTAIFTPATLLAGIWGMNFTHMPELEHPYSYPVALGLLALLGTGMFLWFRRQGWFD